MFATTLASLRLPFRLASLLFFKSKTILGNCYRDTLCSSILYYSSFSVCSMILFGRPSSNLLILKIPCIGNSAIGRYISRTSMNFYISFIMQVPRALCSQATMILPAKASIIERFPSSLSLLSYNDSPATDFSGSGAPNRTCERIDRWEAFFVRSPVPLCMSSPGRFN